MNALTLDFIRRWKWLLAGQFVVTAAAWTVHAQIPQSRVHLEIPAAFAMSWDLMRGVVRAQLGLPWRRRELAAGLWFSAAGTGIVVQTLAMLMGGFVLAPLFGQGTDISILGLHLVLAVLLAGSVQFILTGLPSRPPQNLAGQVKAMVFGGLWGLSMWGCFWVAMFGPAGWAQVTLPQRWIMGLLGGLTVASWFTTQVMVEERALAKGEQTPRRPSGDPLAVPRGVEGWRLWVLQEVRWLLPMAGIVVLAAVFMLSIGAYQGRPGQFPMHYSSMGMLCVMTVFPVLAVAAGTLRVFRGLPVSLSRCALLAAVRPFLGGLVVFAVFTLITVFLPGKPIWPVGEALLGFLPVCGVLSLAQAVILRYQRLPVMLGLLFGLSMLMATFPVLAQRRPPDAGFAVLGLVLLVLSWRLHLHWLRGSSEIYRISQGLMRFVNPGQR